MKAYDRNKPLISLHIPKCAGTSVRQVLEGWFGLNLYYHYFDRDRQQPPPRHFLWVDSEKTRFKEGVCIHGHFNSRRGFGAHDYYPEADQFITFLRQPLERAVSGFFFTKRNAEIAKGHGMTRVLDEGYTLEQHLATADISFLHHFPLPLTMENYRELLDRHFVYLGVMEDLQVSVDRLADRLGFPRTTVPRVNVGDYAGPVPASARQKFEKDHELEYAIYRYALERHTS